MGLPLFIPYNATEMQNEMVPKEDGQNWRGEVKKALQKTITPEMLAKTHKELLKSKSPGVKLGAVKLAYEVMGVGDTPATPRPLIILSTSGLMPPPPTLEGLEGVDILTLPPST